MPSNMAGSKKMPTSIADISINSGAISLKQKPNTSINGRELHAMFQVSIFIPENGEKSERMSVKIGEFISKCNKIMFSLINNNEQCFHSWKFNLPFFSADLANNEYLRALYSNLYTILLSLQNTYSSRSLPSMRVPQNLFSSLRIVKEEAKKMFWVKKTEKNFVKFPTIHTGVPPGRCYCILHVRFTTLITKPQFRNYSTSPLRIRWPHGIRVRMSGVL